MANNNIDQIIKNKLNDFLPDNTPGNWDIFENLLNEKEAEHVALKKFDDTVLSKINNANQTYVHDWSQMQQYLTIIDQRRQAVLIMKSLEAVIVCLLLYTISIIPQNDVIDAPINKTIKSKPASQKVEMASLTKKASKDAGIKNIIINSKHDSGESQSSNNPSDKTLEFGSFASNQNNFKSLESSSDLTETNSNLITSSVINDLSGENQFSSNSTNTQIVDVISTPKSVIEEINVASIPSIDIKPESEFAKSFPMAMAVAKPQSKWLLGAWTSADINTISTPYDKIFSLKAYEHVALNHSAGLSIGHKTDRLSVSSGLSYNRRNYQPRQFVESYGADDLYYFESSLESMKFDFISVPLILAYDFYQSKNWNFYGNINLTGNVLASADYDRREELVLGRPSAPAAFEVENSRLDDKNFASGILKGGSLSDSYFVSVGIGLGLEKRLSDKLSVYVEPSYLHHVFSKDIGIGPNKDRIHSASLQLGVRSAIL